MDDKRPSEELFLSSFRLFSFARLFFANGGPFTCKASFAASLPCSQNRPAPRVQNFAGLPWRLVEDSTIPFLQARGGFQTALIPKSRRSPFFVFFSRSLVLFLSLSLLSLSLPFQATLDRAMASMALGGGSAADWQQQLQQAANAHGGDWAGKSFGVWEH